VGLMCPECIFVTAALDAVTPHPKCLRVDRKKSTTALTKIVTPEAQKAIIASGLGEYELHLINSFNAPLFWPVRKDNGTVAYRNGTAFFLDAGHGPFGVTACHVVEGWERSCIEHQAGGLQLAGHRQFSPVDWAARVTDKDAEIDIAGSSARTF
jgi:hypothetical protein